MSCCKGKKSNEKYSSCNPKFTNFCNAYSGNTQGQDWTNTYVSELTVPDGIQKKYAYVECGYTE